MIDENHAREAFARAYVAMGYLLDRRGDALLEGLVSVPPAARELARRLGHPDRQARAQVLAAELARIAAALDARGFA
jgi:hypothetical protein